MNKASVSCIVLLVTTGSAFAQAQDPPNIVVFLADDVSAVDFKIYDDGIPSTPGLIETPNIDAQLKQKGIRFDIAWASALCSPTRAGIHTGRYAFRTGIGAQINVTGADVGLPATEIIFPKMLDDFAPDPWSSAATGKWHLSEDDYDDNPLVIPENAPVELGYSYWVGQIFPLAPNQLYCKPDFVSWTPWVKWQTEPGQNPVKLTASPTDVLIAAHVDDALNWIQTQAVEPYVVYIALQAPYELYRAPKDGTFTSVDPAPSQCNGCMMMDQKRTCYVAYGENVDFEVGRFLTSLSSFYGEPWENRTTVFFAADNGTPLPVIGPKGAPGQGKGTRYEGGLRVPFLVAGKSIPVANRNTTSQALIHTIDIFATIASMAGADLTTFPNTLDSVDQTPVFQNPGSSVRSYIYSEIFIENVDVLPHVYGSSDLRIARTARYKYVYKPVDGPTQQSFYYIPSGHRVGDEFYDLTLPEEPSNNLNGSLPINEAIHPGANADRVFLLNTIEELLYGN